MEYPLDTLSSAIATAKLLPATASVVLETTVSQATMKSCIPSIILIWIELVFLGLEWGSGAFISELIYQGAHSEIFALGMNEVIATLQEALLEAHWTKLALTLEEIYSHLADSKYSLKSDEIIAILDVCVGVSRILHLIDSRDILRKIFIVVTALLVVIFDLKEVFRSLRVARDACWERFNDALEARWFDVHLIQQGCLEDWDSVRFYIRASSFRVPPSSVLQRIVVEMVQVSRVPLMHSNHFQVISKDLINTLTAVDDGLFTLVNLLQHSMFLPSVSMETVEKTLFICDLFKRYQVQGQNLGSLITPAHDLHILLISRISPESPHLPPPISPLMSALATVKPSLETFIDCLRRISPNLSAYPLLSTEMARLSESVGQSLGHHSTYPENLIREFVQIVAKFPNLLLHVIQGAVCAKKLLPNSIRMQFLESLIDTNPGARDQTYVESVCWLLEGLDQTSIKPIQAKAKKNSVMTLCLASHESIECDLETVLSIPLHTDTIRHNCSRVLQKILDDSETVSENSMIPKTLARSVQVAENFSLIAKCIQLFGDKISPREILKIVLGNDQQGRWWASFMNSTQLVPRLIESESLQVSSDLVSKIPDINRTLSLSQRLDILARIQEIMGKIHPSKL